MTTQKTLHLENARAIHTELLQLIEGMDYCLDWKPSPSEWSARQIIYHLLDTPPDGIPGLLRGIFSGSLQEFDLWADKDNMTPERLSYDMEQVLEDTGRFFQSMEQTLQDATDDGLIGKPVLAHLKSRGRDEERTAQALLEGLFARHWQNHLAQLRELRDSLGV